MSRSRCLARRLTRNRAASLVLVAGVSLASGPLLGCGDDSPPAPPDTAGSGGESGDGACPSDLPASETCGQDTPSFMLDVAPIVEQRCATCHYPQNPLSRYVFSGYDDLYADRQTVLTRIYGCVMPPDGAPQLTPTERRSLLRWLVCGAPDN